MGKKNLEEITHISGILQKILMDYRYESDVELLTLWDHWNNIVGEVVAKNAQPAAYKNKLLLVYTSSSSWIHHLQFLKNNIIEKINSITGRELVGDIKFKIGPL